MSSNQNVSNLKHTLCFFFCLQKPKKSLPAPPLLSLLYVTHHQLYSLMSQSLFLFRSPSLLAIHTGIHWNEMSQRLSLCRTNRKKEDKNVIAQAFSNQLSRLLSIKHRVATMTFIRPLCERCCITAVKAYFLYGDIVG